MPQKSSENNAPSPVPDKQPIPYGQSGPCRRDFQNRTNPESDRAKARLSACAHAKP